jgi:hypothetical protein
MRALLDPDVILDYLLDREPFAQAAGRLVKLKTLPVFSPTDFLNQLTSDRE